MKPVLLPIAIAVLLAAPAGFAQAQSVRITGAVDQPREWSAADLAREPATTETVFLHTGHGAISGSFTGVALWTLLQEAGIKIDPAGKNDIIRHTVTVTGGDGYSAVLSLGEIDPEFGGDQAIIAYQKDGKPIDDPAGFARLVVPGDKAAGRSVSGVVTIEVR